MDNKNISLIWLICGPSSAGKSTFIQSEKCKEITSLPENTPTIMAHTFQSNQALNPETILHYNMLQTETLWEKMIGIFSQNGIKKTEFDFEKIPSWTSIKRARADIKAVVLVCSRDTLLKRIKKRKFVEAKGLNKQKLYPKAKWIKMISSVNLELLYRQWCEELKLNGIPFTLVNSETDTYKVIENESEMLNVIKQEKTKYSKAKIKEILKRKVFEYQRIELPYGFYTKGVDRSDTRDTIFPDSLDGKSLLDIGCALGYMCFEAEKLGAKKVVGYDLKKKRFEGAKILKDIKGSDVEFHLGDIFTETIEEQFDIVLFLNVIHHLPEPVSALRKLSHLAREKLIIEFPTINDIKFKKTVSSFERSWDEFPFIGVSEINTAKQTFVFTPKAIERILMNHDKLFRKIDFLDSPMDDRKIAICHK